MKSVAVIGLGQFGNQVAIGLTQKGFDVIGIDNDVEIVTEIKNLIPKAVILDSKDEKAMRALNIDNVDIAIVAIGSNVQSSLLTTALLQRMAIKQIYVRAINDLQANILSSMGITNIINIEKEMGLQLSSSLVSEGVGRYVQISDHHSLMEISVPNSFFGKTLEDLKLRSKFGINIVGIKVREPDINDEGEITFKEKMTDVPDPKHVFTKDDIMVIVGTDDNINRFVRLGNSDD